MTTLKAALQEACFMELEEIPSEEMLSEDEALTFSAAFERKMKKLIRRADHPIRYRIAQAAACLLLAALLSGCTVLAVSPEAREAFVGWVREMYETYVEYRYTGENQVTPQSVIYYRPTWIPEGYQETEMEESTSQTYICYENEDKLLVFCCTMDADAATLKITADNGDILDVQNVKIGDSSADLYIDPKEDAASGIVWINENGTLFWINGQLSGDELIKIAESVEAVQ